MKEQIHYAVEVYTGVTDVKELATKQEFRTKAEAEEFCKLFAIAVGDEYGKHYVLKIVEE